MDILGLTETKKISTKKNTIKNKTKKSLRLCTKIWEQKKKTKRSCNEEEIKLFRRVGAVLKKFRVIFFSFFFSTHTNLHFCTHTHTHAKEQTGWSAGRQACIKIECSFSPTLYATTPTYWMQFRMRMCACMLVKNKNTYENANTSTHAYISNAIHRTLKWCIGLPYMYVWYITTIHTHRSNAVKRKSFNPELKEEKKTIKNSQKIK